MDAFNVAFSHPEPAAASVRRRCVLAGLRAGTGADARGEGDESTSALIDAVASVLFWALLLTSAVGIVAAPLVVWTMASGLERFDAAVLMTRWMFPYIAFMSLVRALGGGAEHLEALCGAGGHAGASQRLHHRCGLVVRPYSRASRASSRSSP
jgi:putative peptidoglycan lipid II flippase